MMDPDRTKLITDGIRVCYAESKDGINWVKPRLGLREYAGSKENNIILDKTDSGFDNFFVMRDIQSVMSPDDYTKHSRVGRGVVLSALTASISKKLGADKGRRFDSLIQRCGTVPRDLHCLFPSFPIPPHNPEIPQRDTKVSIRIQKLSEPKLLDFGDGDDAAYTKHIALFTAPTML